MSDQTRRVGKPSVKRDAAQLRNAVARHFRLLSKAASAYDEGDDDQVVAMAGILRALLHDRLINHVTPLDQLAFTDTADRLDDDAVAGYGYGITRVLLVYLNGDLDGEENVYGSIVAPLGGAFKDAPPPTVPFSTWWSEDRVVYPTNLTFLTRKYVVYEMANTDAIHIDAELDADYDALTRDTHGITINGQAGALTGDLASAAIRQIAWETQHTLHRALPDLCGPDFPSTPASSYGGTVVRIAAFNRGDRDPDSPPTNETKLEIQGLRDPEARPYFAR